MRLVVRSGSAWAGFEDACGVTRSPNRSDREKPPLTAYFSLDAVYLAISWGCLAFLTKLQLIVHWLAMRVHGARTRAAGAVTKYWYRNATRLLHDDDRTFLDYGYASLDDTEEEVELSDVDEPNRASIQLYRHVIGAVDLAGLDVLEVSCGHGGGASYVMRRLEPRSVVAVDLNPNAIDWCQRRIRFEGLSFFQCDAQCLQFEADRFDAVINVEASHCYPDMRRFLSEVVRVLRPGGYFLFADARIGRKASEALQDELAGSSLELIRKEDITANIVKALEMDSERRLDEISRLGPRFMRRYVEEWAAVKGSSVYESFRRGESVYVSYALRKPMS